MCCIIYRPKDAPLIKEENIKKIIDKNPHGWGISYNNGKTISTIRSLKMEDALEEIQKLEKENIEFLFHARWATHGDKTIENCHPYNLRNGVLFHNGTINIPISKKDKKSDTWYFSKILNKKLKKTNIEKLLNKYNEIIGESRLAIMENNGNIIFHGKWHEIDGCKYSKLNWKTEYYYSSYSSDIKAWYDNYDYWENREKKTISTTHSKQSMNNIINRLKSNDKNITPYLWDISEDDLITVIREYPKAMSYYMSKNMLIFPIMDWEK